MHFIHNYVRVEEDAAWVIECTVCLKRKVLAFRITDSPTGGVDESNLPLYSAHDSRYQDTAPSLWNEYPSFWEHSE